MSSLTSDEFASQLALYQKHIHSDITVVCSQLESNALAHFGENGRSAIKAYTAILGRGSKSIRGSLVLAAYEMCGGKDIAVVMPVARAIEMLHAYLLIVDDVYDQSGTRRGGPSAHVMLAGFHKGYSWHGDSNHFGESVAGCAAIIGCHEAMQEVTRSMLGDAQKIAILRLFNHAISVTAYGQVHDLFNEASRRVVETQVEHTHIWKTAYYTFIAPLQAGAIAAGESESTLDCLHAYGAHMGLAFQAVDDILGTFGDESKSGKSNQDDCKEGKMTLHFAYAWRNASAAQKTILSQSWGNATLTTDEFLACQKIFNETGAVEYVKTLAKEEAALAVATLDKAPKQWDASRLEFLRHLAGYITERQA